MKVDWIHSRDVLPAIGTLGTPDLVWITTYVTSPHPALWQQLWRLGQLTPTRVLASPIAVATQGRRNFYDQLVATSHRFEVRVLSAPLLHAKTVYAVRAASASLLVGSSNLTRGGLEVNEEVNLSVLGDASDHVMVQHRDWFTRLWQVARILSDHCAATAPVEESELPSLIAQLNAADLASLPLGMSPLLGMPPQVNSHRGERGWDAADSVSPPSVPTRPTAPAADRRMTVSTSGRAPTDLGGPQGRSRKDPFEELYPFQKTAYDLAKETLQRSKSPCLALPTGAGKTHVAVELIGNYLLSREFATKYKQRRILVVAPRRELCRHFYEVMTERIPGSRARFALQLGDAIETSDGRADRDRPLVLVTTDRSAGAKNSALLDRLADAGLGSELFDAVVLDEAHHAPSDMYYFAIEDLGRGKCPRVGMTATPFRFDREPLGFDAYITARLPRLIEAGFLARPRYITARTRASYRVERGDLSKSTRDGARDLNASKLASIGRDRTRTESIVREIIAQKRARGWRRTIVFCASVDECENVFDGLRRHGLGAIGCVTSRAPLGDESDDLGRDGTVDAFRKGDLEMLINCQMFIEGFDVPDADSIVIARPTMSLNYYKQMLGRGCRVSIAAGKTTFDLLDFFDDVDFGGMDAQLVHGNREYGLFEMGYAYDDDPDEPDWLDGEVLHCDLGTGHTPHYPLDVPLASLLAELRPDVTAHPLSPFRRAS